MQTFNQVLTAQGLETAGRERSVEVSTKLEDSTYHAVSFFKLDVTSLEKFIIGGNIFH